MKNEDKIPPRLKSVFWSTDISKLHLQKHKGYIIHQILQYGQFEDLHWLFKTYGKKEVIRIFVNQPSKNYPKSVYYFIKNYVLGLKNKILDEQDYITSIFGPIRQRASKNL